MSKLAKPHGADQLKSPPLTGDAGRARAATLDGIKTGAEVALVSRETEAIMATMKVEVKLNCHPAR